MKEVAVLFLEDFPGELSPKLNAWRQVNHFANKLEIKHLDYDTAAIVNLKEVEGKSDEYYLEKAYHLTQNIEHSWTENVEVDVRTKRPRSSSVGDVFVIGVNQYVVASFGFEQLTVQNMGL